MTTLYLKAGRRYVVWGHAEQYLMPNAELSGARSVDAEDSDANARPLE